MKPEATATGYSTTSRVFHWLGALVVFVLVPVGVVMTQEGLPRGLQNGLFILHKNLGVVALVLIALRLAWCAVRPAPAAPVDIPPWQKTASRVTHGLLYALLAIMPVTGYLRVRAGGFPIESLDALGAPLLVPVSDRLETLAQPVHYYGGLALMGLVALHVAAALQHALIRRDGVMRRMWPPIRPRSDA